MQMKLYQKHYSIMLIFVMILSLLTPIAETVASAETIADTDTISVEDGIALDNDGSTQSVQGFIVGFVKGKDNVTDNPSEFTEDYNFAIADRKSTRLNSSHVTIS